MHEIRASSAGKRGQNPLLRPQGVDITRTKDERLDALQLLATEETGFGHVVNIDDSRHMLTLVLPSARRGWRRVLFRAWR